MRDLLPAESRALSALGRGLLGSFELFGYQRVTVPVFEYAAVLERGLGALDPREVLRFVEPESGEVVALQRGVDALTVAILMGHKDPSQLAKVYQHLSHNPKHLLEQAKKAAS